MPRELRQVTLPDGTPFWCLRPSEIKLIYDSVQAYFRNGITVNDGDIVFDVGANIGLFAHQVRQLGRRDVSIYSFEPIPAVFEALQANARHFDPEHWIALPFGLGRHSGTMTFGYHVRASMFSSAYPDASLEERVRWRQTFLRNLHQFPWSVRWLGWLPSFLRSPLLDYGIRRLWKIRTVTCAMRTVSEVVREHGLPRIDLLKIDVEKGEMDVLAGIEDEDWKKIRQLIVEVHDLECGRVAATEALLKQHGFAHVVIEQEPILRGTDIFNLYARRDRAAVPNLRSAG